MTHLEKLVFNSIVCITTRKIVEHREPTHAMRNEIISIMRDYNPDAVLDALRHLVIVNKVSYGPTINDFWFRVNE